MAYETLLYDVKDRIGTITLNRPDRLNAYNDRMASDIRKAMAEAANDPAVRVIILTGAGRGFCAGADMQVLQAVPTDGTPRAASAARGDIGDAFKSKYGPNLDKEFADMTRFAYFMRTKKPIIAAINGPAAGMGLIMSLYCDFRFVSDKAVITSSFAQRGLIAEHGIAWLLPRLIGPAHAFDVLLSARKISPQEAKEMGLVNKVFAADTFMDNVHAYARLLADTVSPRSMAVMKAQIWKSLFQDFGTALEAADAEMPPSFVWPDFKEGVSHFLEKRAPKFADI
ncbi:MAG: enoyl-CoA hydratase [Alphaproteobacteria bacterium]|nr:enoyl-CoA hydratase [Alphaproteobacteria bacterium]MBL6936537.1 enoyl-CoA hydratase [Alphaproteobacteria bacterium]MBL7098412.1 enoyl-CoA hydratase [Alphaproteobacteria bacterium]